MKPAPVLEQDTIFTKFNSQVAVNVSNVVETAAKLDNLTKNPELLTNNLDVKFSVETVDKIVDSQQSLDQVRIPYRFLIAPAMIIC